MTLQRLLFAFIAATLMPSAAAAENTIKIGFPMPLSGPASVYGEPVTKGAEMAVQEINARAASSAASSSCCRATARPAPTRRCASRAS